MTDGSPSNPLVEFADTHLDQTLDRFERGLAPVWEAQAEMSKTLVTLASGSLVLSISVVQFFAGNLLRPRAAWLIPTAWILFALSVLLGAVRHSWMGVARSHRARLEPMRGEIRAKVAALEAGPDLSAKFDSILIDAFNSAGAAPYKAIKVHDALGQAMFWTFAGGLISLLVFAIRNLPF